MPCETQGHFVACFCFKLLFLAFTKLYKEIIKQKNCHYDEVSEGTRYHYYFMQDLYVPTVFLISF